MASRRTPLTPDRRHQLFVDWELSDEEDERVPYPGLTRPLPPLLPAPGTQVQRSDRQNAAKWSMLLTPPPPLPRPSTSQSSAPERDRSTPPARVTAAPASTATATLAQPGPSNLASICTAPPATIPTSPPATAMASLRIREETVLCPPHRSAPATVPASTLAAAMLPPLRLEGHSQAPPVRVELAPGLTAMIPHHAVHVSRRYKLRLPGEKWFLRFDKRGRLTSRRRQELPQ